MVRPVIKIISPPDIPIIAVYSELIIVTKFDTKQNKPAEGVTKHRTALKYMIGF